ncbi:hypothetical protein [Falsiroseomonas sp.]|uniref:hypothetical protein n=1 Tax=Falsiroseomonas sp. TaxID=2870721 RepID=UPI003565B32B
MALPASGPPPAGGAPPAILHRQLRLHLYRILDRLEAATARERAELEQERAALARHCEARATERETAARTTVAQLETRLAELEREVEVERRVRALLETRAAGPERPLAVSQAASDAAPSAPPLVAQGRAGDPDPSAADRGPLFSANEAAYRARRADPRLGGRSLGSKATEDVEVAFWLWRGLAGDRPMLDYTREEADDLRGDMLRMLASYGKGGPKREMRAKHGPRHWMEVADQRQRTIDQHNAALPEGHPDRKADVERMSLRTVKKHYTSLSGYWRWLEARKVLPRGTNIFSEWDWPGTKGWHDDRDADLNLLLRSSWFGADRRGTDH